MGFGRLEFLNDGVKQDLQTILVHADKNEGHLVLDVNSKNEWVIGYTFGREAEDSDMAGGAAYGSRTLSSSLQEIVSDLGC